MLRKKVVEDLIITPFITGGWQYLVLASVCPSGLVLLGHPSVLGAQMVLVCSL